MDSDIRQAPSYTLSQKVRGYLQRLPSRALFRRPCRIETDVPLVSFTFDDFPRSALLTGGAILRTHAATGTYYAAFGLMGQQAPAGQIFYAEDLDRLFKEGHELGCHTFDHCHSFEANPLAFEDSIVRNLSALRELFPSASFRSFSYPMAEPRLRIKRNASRHFLCCRGGDQKLNEGTADLNRLSAFFLEKSWGGPAAAKRMIDRNQKSRGWLILATHDVSDTPSRFGCTPGFFEDIVKYAIASGARVLPVAQACELLTANYRVR